MRRLAIETAGSVCSVALFDGEAVVGHAHERVARGHAERLLPLVASLQPQPVDEILVDCGPGSFTGLRVGLAAAIALGIGWQVPVRGFGALALLVAGSEVRADALAVAVGGGHGQLFVQRFAPLPLVPSGPPRSLLPEMARDVVGDLPLVGDAVAARMLDRPDLRVVEPDAALVLRLPAELRTLPAHPIYLREADAKPMATA